MIEFIFFAVSVTLNMGLLALYVHSRDENWKNRQRVCYLEQKLFARMQLIDELRSVADDMEKEDDDVVRIHGTFDLQEKDDGKRDPVRTLEEKGFV